MKNVKLGRNDLIKIWDEEYELIKNLAPLKGFQFRTWLVRNTTNGKEYVAKITRKRKRALNELRVYLCLKNRGYESRYYSEMRAFDHNTTVIKSDGRQYDGFWTILLQYLTWPKFQPLDDFIKNCTDKKIIPKVVRKLRRRLDRLHECGVAHCDIREANVMVKTTDETVGVRLIDFGLSKIGADEQSKRKDIKRAENIIKKLQKIV
jgi:serine/threonine protein kinase